MAPRHDATLVPAYLLHTRPYRETSVIADFFTQHQGRVSGVIRGVRGKKSKLKSYLQPFSPLLIGWIGKHELVTVTQLESAGCHHRLKANRLICGLYLNELLVRLLPAWQSYSDLFAHYLTAMTSLSDPKTALQGNLRCFERQLLSALGYGVDFRNEAHGGHSIDAKAYYCYAPGEGFQRSSADFQQLGTYLGAWLLAIGQDSYGDPEVSQAAKHLSRIMLAPLLGTRPLRSRELLIPAFIKQNGEGSLCQ